MPISLSDLIKQTGRDGSQGLSAASFYYIVDTTDIDFRVDGFINAGGISGGLGIPTGVAAFQKKFIVLDTAGLAAAGFTPTQAGIGNNDIIEKRDTTWGIHFDASLTGKGASGGNLAYSIPEKAFYFYNGTSWARLGGGSLDTSSLTAGIAIGISAGSNGTLVFNNLGVTSFNGQTGAVNYYPPFATASVTGVAAFPASFFSVANGVVSLSGAYASTLTGDTVGATGSLTANTVNGVKIIDARLATINATGVASFSSTNFDVTNGAVTIKTGGVPNDALVNSSVTFRDSYGVTDNLPLGETFTLTSGSEIFKISTAGNNQFLFTYLGITSFNGQTGAVNYYPPIASASATGVAFFPAAQFAVSTTGMVSLSGPYDFYGLTGVTSASFPQGLSSTGTMGDRLVVATGPTRDPFRTYVKFGDAWVQTGVAGIGQGPAGATGEPGAPGERGATGFTGATGAGYLSLSGTEVENIDQLFVGDTVPFSIVVATGTSTPAYSVGQTIIASADSNNYLIGTVTSWNTATNVLSLILTKIVGSGTHTSWTINLSGEPGVRGNTGSNGTNGATGATGTTGAVGHHISLFNGTSQFDQIKFIDSGTIGFDNINNPNHDAFLDFILGEVTGGNNVVITFTNRTTSTPSAAFVTTGTAKTPTYPWEFIGSYVYGNEGTFGKSNTQSIDIHFTVNGKDGITGSGIGFATSWGVTASGVSQPTGYTAGQILVARGAIPSNIIAVWMPPYDLFGKSLTAVYEKAWAQGGTNGNPVKGTLYVNMVGQGAGGITNDTFVFNVTDIPGIVPNTYTQFNGTLVSGSTGMFGNPSTSIQNIKTSAWFVPFGAKGNTGQVSLSGYGTYYGLTHTSATLESYTNQRGRRYLYMTESGGITWDYIRPQDIYNPSDFLFDILTFGYAGTAVSRISTSNRNIGASNFSATYRLGPPATANIVCTNSTFAISGFPYQSSNADMTTWSGGSPTISGGSLSTITIQLQVTGTNETSIGGTRYRTSNINFTNRNDFVYGVTFAAYLTGNPQSPDLITGGKVFQEFTSSQAQNQTPTGYNVSWTQASNGAAPGVAHYIYFGYPARLHNESWTKDNFFLNNGTNPGGMELQSLGFNGGLSTINYTNSAGYSEAYKVWRSNQQWTPEAVPTVGIRTV
jgi:hypothetical protein